MKNLSFILVVLFLSLAASCDKEDPVLSEVTSIELSFKANFDGQTFLTDQVYDYNGYPMKLSLFDFYISDVNLVQNDGSSIQQTELVEVELIDLSFDSSDLAGAESGQTLRFNNIEVGEYAGLNIGLGVSADLNRTEYTDYPSNHPLNNSALYWSGWSSFIFARIEGRLDLDNDGTFEKGFVFHTGKDASFQSKDINSMIELDKNNVRNFSFNIDLKKLFQTIEPLCDQDADGYIDMHLTECDGTHADDDLEIAESIMINFRNAIVMEQ